MTEKRGFVVGTVGDNYVWTYPYLPSDVRGVTEVGSRDALDAIELASHFSCPVVAFEADPRQFEICRSNIAETDAPVTLRREALTDVDGMIQFWQVDPSLYSNDGVSSIFEVDFSNRQRLDPDRERAAVQVPIEVRAARWESLNLDAPTLLVMDVEGAELKALAGFGDRISEVEYIALETAPVSLHKGGSSFRQVHMYLTKRGFDLIASEPFGADLGKLRRHLRETAVKSRIKNPIGRRRMQGFFNVLYRNSQ